MTTAADLIEIIERNGTSLDRRIEAAHSLAELGDPRAARMDAVRIEGGPFVMGDPGRDVTVATYAIDRYPVTVAAYATFVDDGGYNDSSVWSRDGWAWRSAEAIEKPRFWGEDEWRVYLTPNHPVVGV
ncbi:MAG: SUMF1/EgtB/PvdO family nonheme iron enzyme, partial [Polyangiaceae bacterium]